MADTTVRLNPIGHDALASCSACGALVAMSDSAAVEQHNHWHAAHPGPPPATQPTARLA
jgi:hypothetical protein